MRSLVSGVVAAARSAAGRGAEEDDGVKQAPVPPPPAPSRARVILIGVAAGLLGWLVGFAMMRIWG